MPDKVENVLKFLQKEKKRGYWIFIALICGKGKSVTQVSIFQPSEAAYDCYKKWMNILKPPVKVCKIGVVAKKFVPAIKSAIEKERKRLERERKRLERARKKLKNE